MTLHGLVLALHNWLRFHLTGQAGSYIAMWTAVLVANSGTTSPWVWTLPTVIESPVILWIMREVALGVLGVLGGSEVFSGWGETYDRLPRDLSLPCVPYR